MFLFYLCIAMPISINNESELYLSLRGPPKDAKRVKTDAKGVTHYKGSIVKHFQTSTLLALLLTPKAL